MAPSRSGSCLTPCFPIIPAPLADVSPLWRLFSKGKELLDSVLNYRLTAGLIFSVILALVVTLVRSDDFSRRVEAYRNHTAQIEEHLSTARTYQQLEPDIVAAPQPLSVFYEGVDRSALGTLLVAFLCCLAVVTTNPDFHLDLEGTGLRLHEGTG